MKNTIIALVFFVLLTSTAVVCADTPNIIMQFSVGSIGGYNIKVDKGGFPTACSLPPTLLASSRGTCKMAAIGGGSFPSVILEKDGERCELGFAVTNDQPTLHKGICFIEGVNIAHPSWDSHNPTVPITINLP